MHLLMIARGFASPHRISAIARTTALIRFSFDDPCDDTSEEAAHKTARRSSATCLMNSLIVRASFYSSRWTRRTWRNKTNIPFLRAVDVPNKRMWQLSDGIGTRSYILHRSDKYNAHGPYKLNTSVTKRSFATVNFIIGVILWSAQIKLLMIFNYIRHSTFVIGISLSHGRLLHLLSVVPRCNHLAETFPEYRRSTTTKNEKKKIDPRERIVAWGLSVTSVILASLGIETLIDYNSKIIEVAQGRSNSSFQLHFSNTLRIRNKTYIRVICKEKKKKKKNKREILSRFIILLSKLFSKLQSICYLQMKYYSLTKQARYLSPNLIVI